MFFIIFAAIYASLNVYLYTGLHDAVGRHTLLGALLIAFLFASIFLGKWLEAKAPSRIALPVVRIGYTWFGVCCILATLSLVGDALQLFAPLTDAAIFYTAICVGGLASLAGAYRARRPVLRTIELQSSKLNYTRERPLRVVQISDLHLGDGSSLHRARRLVDRLLAARPDVVVSTGDLFDSFLETLQPYVAELQRIEAPLGKYAICGNHEVYAGLDRAMALTRDSGFTPLRNERVSLDGLEIVGVEDPASPRQADEAVLLDSVDRSRFTLLLKHRPEIHAPSLERFDLQLSGHTHGGQIFPFHLFVKLAYRAKVGLSEIAPKRYLYLSRGTGSWGPQIRLFAPPEITLLLLHNGRD